MNIEDIKTVAIYCRVSTKEQTTENQKRILAKFCENKGWEYKIIEETESTRKTRPRKQALLDALRKRVFDGVVVYKLDRWARSSTELILELDEFNNKGIAFVSYTDNIDMTTASGTMLVGILSVIAQFERDITRERVLAGMARRRAQGLPMGRPKGSKDKKYRRKSGYHLRWAGKKTPPEFDGDVIPKKEGNVNKHQFLNTIDKNKEGEINEKNI